MHDALPRILLSSCPKGYTKDLDKAVSPRDTIANVRKRLSALNLDILAATERVDRGRLGIPVFISRAGVDAKRIMPTRKQMGKGSSKEQAEASAIMELVERFSYFSFWETPRYFQTLFFSEAEKRFGSALLPVTEILKSVQENLPIENARKIFSLVPWTFYPATNLANGETVWIPLDWFKTINEFNGCSAGNSTEESILQGLCELIERHVCALISKEERRTPTILQESARDETLRSLFQAFSREHINLILKDFSLDMPLPTVACVAWDPKTFPEHSEIVFTAGTASSPEKAAIRAVTEVAQLAGDFCTNACYEASGLPKYTSLTDIDWLLEGPSIRFEAIAGVEREDIADEIRTAIAQLDPLHVYSVQTSYPPLGIPAHYTIIPGLSFRERDTNQSLGLFVGRKLVEEGDREAVEKGLQDIESVYGQAHFIPFFKGMFAMRNEDFNEAETWFTKAIALQPDKTAKGLATFYAGYSLSQKGDWEKALPVLTQAHELCPDMKEYANYLGVALFKTKAYREAKTLFQKALSIDKGSATDLANLGLCEKMLGEREKAKEHLEEAFALDQSLLFAKQHLDELTKQ